MILRLVSGSADPGQRGQEALLLVGDQLDAGGGDVVALHLFALALAQQAVVDEDAGQLVADGALHQRGGDGGVDPAGQAADHLLRCRSGPDRSTCSSRMLPVVQFGSMPAHLVQEVLQHLLAVRRSASPPGATARR